MASQNGSVLCGCPSVLFHDYWADCLKTSYDDNSRIPHNCAVSYFRFPTMLRQWSKLCCHYCHGAVIIEPRIQGIQRCYHWARYWTYGLQDIRFSIFIIRPRNEVYVATGCKRQSWISLFSNNMTRKWDQTWKIGLTVPWVNLIFLSLSYFRGDRSVHWVLFFCCIFIYPCVKNISFSPSTSWLLNEYHNTMCFWNDM